MPDHLEGKEKKNKGLIWHWHGSGNTPTMIFAANKLYQAERLENPTIFFIIDRIELDRTDEDFKNIVRSPVTSISVESGIEKPIIIEPQ